MRGIENSLYNESDASQTNKLTLEVSVEETGMWLLSNLVRIWISLMIYN